LSRAIEIRRAARERNGATSAVSSSSVRDRVASLDTLVLARRCERARAFQRRNTIERAGLS
jgi:hypothetical protein